MTNANESVMRFFFRYYNTHAIQLLAPTSNSRVGSFMIKVNTNNSLQWGERRELFLLRLPLDLPPLPSLPLLPPLLHILSSSFRFLFSSSSSSSSSSLLI